MKHRLFRLSTLLLLLAPALFAQSTLSFRQIEAALEDELYPLAEQQIWESLSIQRTPEEQATLTLLLIRTLTGQERFDDAVILADESSTLPKQDAFAYWRARALFEKGDFEAVLDSLEKGEKQLETKAYAPAALRLKGRAQQAAGDLKAAEKTFAAFNKKFHGDENSAQNLLDLAAVHRARGKEKDTVKTLRELLKDYPDHPLADTGRLELARELIADEGKKERTEAQTLLSELSAKTSAHPRLRIPAGVELASLEQRLGNPAAAADALQRAAALTSDTFLRVRQKAARANLLIEDGQTREAFALFDEAIEEASSQALAAEVLIQKAEALLKTANWPAAEKAFQAYLDITTDPAAQARALFGKGWSLWEQQRYEEAAVAFENAAEKCPAPAHCVSALLKAGDARLAAGQYQKGHDNYHRITTQYPDAPEAPRALYQSGVANLLAGQTEEARLHFIAVETDFPDSEFAPLAALQLAELLKGEQQWESALEEYRRIAGQYTNAVAQAAATHQQGLILYRLTQWDAALEKFRTVSSGYPESAEAPQAYYMRGFCRYRQGDTEAALNLCQSFIRNYPDSVWTPEVLFWLGEYYYNSGNYAEAQNMFTEVADRFPGHELSDDALFWAGNALLKQTSFLDAFTTYSRLAKEYPASPLLLKTRFAQGEALAELGEFSRAILAYEEVIKAAPDEPLADRARGRLGDCLFTLGTAEAGRYQEALTAYQALFKRQEAPFALKLQALYKIARCEDKLGLKDKAFAHYMETVYTGVGSETPLSPEAVAWFTRAAFEAAAFQEQQQRWPEAINIYERIIEAGVPAQSEALTRIEKIRQEHASTL
jgi:TolA-binding protein